MKSLDCGQSRFSSDRASGEAIVVGAVVGAVIGLGVRPTVDRIDHYIMKHILLKTRSRRLPSIPELPPLVM